MIPKYRFYIRIGSQTATQTEVHPIWKDDLSLEYKMESGQWFFRSELSGSIDLLRADYDLIMNQAFGTVFYLDIQISDNGASWSQYWRGKFTLTDCKVNVDDKILTVKPQVVDNYTDILAGMEKEFDLIKLAPEINRIRISKRPAIQIFDTASETVTCVCGNLSFEQEASLPDENPMQFLVNHCHFAKCSSETELVFTDVPYGYESGFATPFFGTITGDGSTLTNSVDTYFIIYFEYEFNSIYFNGLRVYSRSQPDDKKWEFSQNNIGEYLALPSEIEFASQHEGVGNLKADCIEHGIFSRVICNKSSVSGTDTYEIPTDDLVSYNRNYRRCYPYDVSGMMYSSSRVSSYPTEWGLDDNGYYYLPPDDTYQYIPIGRNMWGVQSIWLRKTNDYQSIETNANYEFMLNDAYPLWSCIQVILDEIAPGVYFGGTSAYSNFLYSGSDPLQLRNNALYLTPKSNITNGEYQTPAQKAPIRLKDIFNMLKNVYKCYWFVGTVNGYPALRIEHVEYFLKGGSYYYNPSVGIDLTALTNKRNGKAWSFGTSVYEYEKAEMPERYQFAWMDEVTSPFKGQPIEVVSPFVEQGRVEEITVANFTSDIDIMQLDPSSISNDGFALLNALPDGNGGLYVPIVTDYIGSVSHRMQNGWLSFHKLEWAYLRSNMPASNLKIGNDTVQVWSVSRNKKQTVNIPLPLADPDLMRLVKTGIGNGKIQQMTIRLTSRMAKTQLRYDTE